MGPAPMPGEAKLQVMDVPAHAFIAIIYIKPNATPVQLVLNLGEEGQPPSVIELGMAAETKFAAANGGRVLLPPRKAQFKAVSRNDAIKSVTYFSADVVAYVARFQADQMQRQSDLASKAADEAERVAEAQAQAAADEAAQGPSLHVLDQRELDLPPEG